MEAPSVGTHSLVLYINHTFIVDCSPKNSKLKIVCKKPGQEPGRRINRHLTAAPAARNRRMTAIPTSHHVVGGGLSLCEGWPGIAWTWGGELIVGLDVASGERSVAGRISGADACSVEPSVAT